MYPGATQRVQMICQTTNREGNYSKNQTMKICMVLSDIGQCFFNKKRLFGNYSFFYFTSFLHNFSARLIFDVDLYSKIYGNHFLN